MGRLIWRAAPYAVRLVWPGLVAAALIVLSIAVLGHGRSGELDPLLAVCAIGAAVVGVAMCVLWAAVSIHIYRRADTPPPPL
jgi:lipopolysaccharide export LptBFGC system permease protein LptF